ncbi:hypothetical protein WN51_07085 [Melipona quadrifasciata]|uniref:Uncharacterized protein n=1 Tax=Melipona quadrifasciata TaxID=166423 RepID=A0A0M8ZPM0_9HYME|nr:hypothetical protein WN51_07085 [Melipona quadrifasciata]
MKRRFPRYSMTHIFVGGEGIDFHQILIKLIKFPLVNIGDSLTRRYNNNNNTDRNNIDESTSHKRSREILQTR